MTNSLLDFSITLRTLQEKNKLPSNAVCSFFHQHFVFIIIQYMYAIVICKYAVVPKMDWAKFILIHILSTFHLIIHVCRPCAGIDVLFSPSPVLATPLWPGLLLQRFLSPRPVSQSLLSLCLSFQWVSSSRNTPFMSQHLRIYPVLSCHYIWRLYFLSSRHIFLKVLVWFLLSHLLSPCSWLS